MTRFDDVPLPYTSSAPLPNRQPTLRTGGTVKRSKTLTRPERHVAPAPLINPAGGATEQKAQGSGVDWWTITSWILTFYCPNAFLKAAGIKEAGSRQAWREKMALVTIACLMGAFVGFFTMGLQSALCPGGSTNSAVEILGTHDATLSIGGYAFNITEAATTDLVDFFTLAADMPGQDITTLFTRSKSDYPSCTSTKTYASMSYCSNNATTTATNTSTCALGTLSNATLTTLKLTNITLWEAYTWQQVAAMKNYIVIDGLVLNMNPYISANPTALSNDTVDAAIRNAINNQSSSGKDVTRQFYNTVELKEAIDCLTSRYLAGRIDKTTPGCFIASILLYASLIVILAVVLIRFFMAIVFSWFIASTLVSKPNTTGKSGVSPSVMPEGANVSVNNQTGTAPWAQPSKISKRNPNAPNGSVMGDVDASSPIMSLSRIGSELFTVCLITCYSEGEEGIRGTLDSIAGTTYPDKRKLIFIVCDGMITGAGEKASTPDICVGMLEADPRFGNPQPMGYLAVGSGAKRENRAMVYAGHYVTKNGHRVPTVIIVKCGMPAEANEAKPGNRGKRDSQLILMNFFSRVTYNDRMAPLDYDLFRKLHTLMGVTPDFFEVCLMVDADTVVYPDSLTYLVHAMARDNMLMGACGETRIANKRQSWVTAIQVYEYYISHHHTKAFESVFGGVTCLPGCFSMYRIKARKDTENDWVPVLVKPEIVREYSQSDVTTLHQKNLLLLGEDRFLSTILLRTFPNRRNIFLPQARCRTIAPDTFSVLLSQRRRWINSTVHNLMELVLVRDLCGTFCFSMQFVVFMDLVGTVVLPIAICLTLALIVNSILSPPNSFEEAIPLMLLGCVLGLPAFLIVITTRKLIYVAWMGVYLLALPIWNFVLPVYSFWHFDDFSWGETRKVEGEVVDKSGHGPDKEAIAFEGTTIPLRRWDDWERSRLRKLRREEKRRRQMERMHGRGFYGEGDELGVPDRGFARSEYDSDSGSIMSSEEDVWGADVGGYDENNPAYPPPPTALAPEMVHGHGGKTLGMDQMAAILDQGFEQPTAPGTVAWRPDRNAPSPLHRNQQSYVPSNGTASPVTPVGDYTPRTDQYARSSRSDTYSPRSEQYAALSPPSARNSNVGTLPGGQATTTAVESYPLTAGHARQRSGGGAVMGNGNGNGYGPLGPLAEDGADGYKRM